jgi:hypothetical protein
MKLNSLVVDTPLFNGRHWGEKSFLVYSWTVWAGRTKEAV